MAIALPVSVIAAWSRVHVEVDVRPAAVVASRKDTLVGDPAVGVGELYPAQVVLVLDLSRIQRVLPASLQCRAYMATPANGDPLMARSAITSSSVIGTPSAVALPVPKVDRMSARTIPLYSSTSGPFESSPGYGPAVSSGISEEDIEVDAVEAVEPQRPATVEQRLNVETETLVDDLVLRAGEGAALVGGLWFVHALTCRRKVGRLCGRCEPAWERNTADEPRCLASR
ncbi:hypothetical protein AB0J40_10440 [Amycolatopsis sp. NPDC049691]|uniref:hypothetical protein n=1 Tax=Amycolatopsis sp. NPDC049691 TaxID=3155155 RepID=UPI00341B181E